MSEPCHKVELKRLPLLSEGILVAKDVEAVVIIVDKSFVVTFTSKVVSVGNHIFILMRITSYRYVNLF